MTLKLTTAQSDRAAGVLLAVAAGDALGAGYEFDPPLADDVEVRMLGGGSFGWAPGEWTDDTSMALAIAEVSAEGVDLRSPEAQDRIAARWIGWAEDAPDVGVQTQQVIAAGRRGIGSVAARLRTAASELHARTGRTAGNGSLMRTAPVALAYLDDPDALVEAAHALSALTHADPEAGEACALWCLAIRHAVLEGTFDGLRLAVDDLPSDRRAVWSYRLDLAQELPPSAFSRNGWVVEALQGAWSAIAHAHVRGDGQRADHLRLALEAAVRGGRDTDTVAAIAGALLGARWGASAVPSAWRRLLHGWPGLRGRDLVRLGVLTARHGHADAAGWPSAPLVDYSTYESSALVRHPHDEGVWLAGVGALDDLPQGIDAVVSLCRLGADQVPAAGVRPEDHSRCGWSTAPTPRRTRTSASSSATPSRRSRPCAPTDAPCCCTASRRRAGPRPWPRCTAHVSPDAPLGSASRKFSGCCPVRIRTVRSSRSSKGRESRGASRPGAAIMSAVDSAAEDRDITLRADEADDLLDVLEAVVVALDQMGSRWADGQDPEHRWIYEYFTTGGASVRLAHARGILHTAYARLYSEDELEAKWDELPVQYWNGGGPERP